MNYTFLIVTILTTFISLCFFKKKFWENRYLILGINTAVLIVTFVVLNFALKSTFHTVTQVSSNTPLIFNKYYVYDSVVKNNWTIEDAKLETLRRDKLKKKTHTYVVLSKYKGNVQINMLDKNYDAHTFDPSDYYIVKGKTDTAYMIDIFLEPQSESKWLAPIGVVRTTIAMFIVLPEKDYNKLPLAYKSIVPGEFDRNVLNKL